MPAFGLLRDVQDTAMKIRALTFDLYMARKERNPYVEEIGQALAALEAEWPAKCPVLNRHCARCREQKREGDAGVRLPPTIMCNATTEQWASVLNVCPYVRS